MARKRGKATAHSLVSKSRHGISLKPKAFQSLTQIAKKAGLSKSELLEGIARGLVAIASDSAATKITLEIAPEATEQTNGSQATSTNTVIDAAGADREIDTRVSESESYEELKQKFDRQTDRIAKLQQQLEAQQAQSSQTHQQELAAKDDEIAKLQQQLEAQQARAEQQMQSERPLEQELAAKDDEIAKLQQQLEAQQARAEQQMQSERPLEQELAAKDDEIANLQQQLEAQQARAEQQMQSEQALQQKIQEQADLINNLKIQLLEQFWDWMKIAFLCGLLPIFVALLFGYYYVKQQ